MAKFEITARTEIELSKIIEAENMDEAWNIATENDSEVFDFDTDFVDVNDNKYEVITIELLHEKLP